MSDWAAAWADEGDIVDVFADWHDSSVSVELFGGGSFDGATYEAPQVADEIMVDSVARLVRDPEGNQRLSSTTLHVPAQHAAKFALHARVTLPGGEKSTVIQIADFTKYGLFNYKLVSLE